METTDFNNSYMTWSSNHDFTDTRKPGHTPWSNAARIMIDASCTISDSSGAIVDELYLIAPCRTEWMYRETELLQNPNGEYRRIFSKTHALQRIVGKSIDESGPIQHEPAMSTDAYNWINFSIVPKSATVLDTDQAVIDATKRNVPINARTTYTANGLTATMEYPIRTMNYQEERVRFQVDTGPLVFPDLAADAERLIDRCYLAHTVYNTFTYAEFVGKQATPLIIAGQVATSIYHYSRFWELDVTNQLYSVDGPTSNV